MGDAVNVPARLQAQAEPGTVLVGEDTAARVEPLFEWGPTVELELKGKSGTVAARPVIAPLATPVSTRGIEGVQAPVVGRERELDSRPRARASRSRGHGRDRGHDRRARDRQDPAPLGVPRHVRPGLGAAGRPRWLEGKCVSYGESMTYWPFRDLVRSWLGVLADEPEMRVRVALRRNVERLFGDRAAELYPYLAAMLGLTLEPDDQTRLGELSPEALQYRTFEVVRALAAAPRRGRPGRGRPRGPALGRRHLAAAPRTAAARHRRLRAPPRPHPPSGTRPPRLAAQGRRRAGPSAPHHGDGAGGALG